MTGYHKDRAQYESGHGGYSGTIAEKDRFVVIDTTSKSLDMGEWLFFGWASS